MYYTNFFKTWALARIDFMIPNTKVLLNPQERGVTIFVAQMFYLSQFSGGIQTFDLWMMTTVFNYCPTTVIPKCNLGNQFDL
jgi:hypothetical protein